MGKPYHAGMAASNGIEAAKLSKLGFVSREDGIECDQGFFQTHGWDNKRLILHIARRPALGDCFSFRVEADALHTMLVYISEGRAFPTAKRMIGHRNRYRYINADHTDIHLRGKFARCQTIAGEQCHAIAILVLARQAGGFLKACLLYTSPSPRDTIRSRMPSSA